MGPGSTSSEANDVYSTLSDPWRAAFDEAWESWRSGNFGIGAVVIDPSNGEIVGRGRNRVGEKSVKARTLTGNMTAHAEMNALASLNRFNAEGLILYTTLEPCLMCTAAAMQMKVATVHFAASDEFYAGIDELWGHHRVTSERRLVRTGPFDGQQKRLAHIARLMPLLFTLEHFPGRSAEQLARAEHPALTAVAEGVSLNQRFSEARRSGSFLDGLTAVWKLLPE